MDEDDLVEDCVFFGGLIEYLKKFVYYFLLDKCDFVCDSGVDFWFVESCYSFYVGFFFVVVEKSLDI